jgi:hypothetical protein
VIKPLEDGSTPFDYWSLHANACDTDTAKLAFSRAVKFYFRAQMHKNSGLGDMLMDVMDVMDHLKLG